MHCYNRLSQIKAFKLSNTSVVSLFTEIGKFKTKGLSTGTGLHVVPSHGRMGKIEWQKDSQEESESVEPVVIQNPYPQDNVTCSNHQPIQSQRHWPYDYNTGYFPHLKTVLL